MGSTGAVRSRAWICGFSSMLKTAAFAGGARYKPTTSRILSISSGSGEILNVSVRQGCSPNVRQIRSTLDGDMPTRLAQLPLRPVRGALGHLLQRAHHHLLHLGIGDGARHTWPRIIG